MTIAQERPVLPVAGDLTPELRHADWWSDAMVTAAGIPVVDVPMVTVGGGIGSFVTVDYLRIAGTSTSQIAVLSNLDRPWQTYEYLCRVSQITRNHRIRSDAASRPDCIWGFPSFALQEAAQQPSFRPMWQVLIEPMFADFYTPPLGMVLEAIEREAHRIRYWDMLARGQVRMVRRRTGGGYFTILTPWPGTSATRRIAYRSRFVHLAVGYAGLTYLNQLQDFRASRREYYRVVNAYEDHEHVYVSLSQRPGRVLVRGGGIVASRVLERLIDDRERLGLSTEIVHLFRTFVDRSQGPPWSRRRGRDGWAYQGFNYPKSVWGGQAKARARRLEGRDRARFYADIGGTTTAYRRLWQRQLQAGRSGGWYRNLSGSIESLKVDVDGRLVAGIRSDAGWVDVGVDYVIDCTGLQGDPGSHRVIDDLFQHSNAGRNPVGGLDVSPSFEVRGTRSDTGRLYASGQAALGGYFPGVDTFLGLQIAAQDIVYDLADQGFCRRLGPFRSLRQWWKWACNQEI